MGQAKKRGTFEQRREEAQIRVPAKRPGFVMTMLMALLASGVPPKR